MLPGTEQIITLEVNEQNLERGRELEREREREREFGKINMIHMNMNDAWELSYNRHMYGAYHVAAIC